MMIKASAGREGLPPLGGSSKNVHQTGELTLEVHD